MVLIKRSVEIINLKSMQDSIQFIEVTDHTLCGFASTHKGS